MRLAFGLFLVVSTAGCEQAAAVDQLADRFVDAYYIRFDFEEALKHTTGGATARVERDRERATLTRSQVSLEGSKSRVYYEKPERRQAGPDQVQFTYRLDVRAGSSQFEQKVVVMTARRDGVWKVVRFFEVRPELPPGVGVPPGAEGRERVRGSTEAAQPDRIP